MEYIMVFPFETVILVGKWVVSDVLPLVIHQLRHEVKMIITLANQL